jgi:thioesterase domain-containing protein
LSLAHAAALVCLRSALLDEASERGGLAVVGVDETTALARLSTAGGGLSLAGMNADQLALVAGPHDALERFCAACEQEGLFARKVRAPAPSHSPLVQDKADELGRSLSNLRQGPPKTPWYSSVLGRLVGSADVGIAYWVKNMASQVRFAAAARAVFDDRHRVLVELSPHPLLVHGLRLENRQVDGEPVTAIPSLARNRPSNDALVDAVAALYCAGVPVTWPFADVQRAPEIELPMVAWVRASHWMDPMAGHVAATPGGSAVGKRDGADRVDATPSLERISRRIAGLLGTGPGALDLDAPLGDLGVDSLGALGVLAELTRGSGRTIAVGRFLRSSVRQIVAILETPDGGGDTDAKSGDSPGRAVWMRPSESGRVIVVIHPIGGSIDCYRPLVRAMGDVACMGIERASPSPSMPIEALATAYIELLREALAARGSDGGSGYQLLGWSFGGFVVHEMARQLAQLGTPTSRVAIVDSPAHQLANVASLLRNEAELVRMFSNDVLRLLDRRAGPRALPANVIGDAHTIAEVCDRLRKLEIDVPPTDVMEDRFAIFRANAEALAAHRPHAFTGTMHLYAASESQAEAMDSDLGWRAFCPALHRVDLVGHHYDVFSGENAAIVASAEQFIAPST